MNMKAAIGVVILACVIGVLWFAISPHPAAAPVHSAVTDDYLDATYTIDGASVALANGVYEAAAAPGSASKTVTRFFGNEANGDVNGDSKPDSAFLLTQETGGSGTFYYLAVALATSTGYIGTNAVFLGDRIAPQTTEIKNGYIIVNYADRAAGEPMSSRPSVGVSRYFAVSGTTLAETSRPASTANTAESGAHCGGNMLNAPTCAAGYHCAPTPGSHLPFGDVGGTCVPD
ncbi:MAG: hypothetical protein KGI73_03470 [Patescibacteria group bacterium]|nr:hypothetical protein [Patescibacteria group bacterium]